MSYATSGSYHDRRHMAREDRTSRSTSSHYRTPKAASGQSGTYGTYIYPVDRVRYQSGSSSSCYCNCCPHETQSSYKPPPRSTGKYRGSEHDSLHSQSSPKQSSQYPSRIYINVEDKTEGPLGLRHGRSFKVSISSRSTTGDIVSFLAPDRHEQKVLVRWRDGVTEPFDDLVSLNEIARNAKELIIKDRKRVHWA